MNELNRLIGVLAILAVAGSASAHEHANLNAPVLPDRGGITAAKQASQKVLRLQDSASQREFCAQVVDVSDSVAACTASKCQRPFDYGTQSSEPMASGVRAIYVSDCDVAGVAQGHLLWGPANVLILQPNRAAEKNLWDQTKYKAGKAIKLWTEASSGTLSMKGGRLQWVESDD